MKILSTFILMLFMAKGCTPSEVKKESENISFEYEAMTRGGFKKVLAKQDTIYSINAREGKAIEKKLSKSDWNDMLTLLSKVDVENIKNLKAPTEKRFHDGAMIAKLRVIFKDKTYESATFDHKSPPAEIEKLVNKIVESSDLDNK